MKRGETDADTCRINGWVVGDRLEGDEGFGPDVIEITAIGEKLILAKCITRSEGEMTWTLTCRDWKKVVVDN